MNKSLELRRLFAAPLEFYHEGPARNEKEPVWPALLLLQLDVLNAELHLSPVASAALSGALERDHTVAQAFFSLRIFTAWTAWFAASSTALCFVPANSGFATSRNRVFSVRKQRLW